MKRHQREKLYIYIYIFTINSHHCMERMEKIMGLKIAVLNYPFSNFYFNYNITYFMLIDVLLNHKNMILIL